MSDTPEPDARRLVEALTESQQELATLVRRVAAQGGEMTTADHTEAARCSLLGSAARQQMTDFMRAVEANRPILCPDADTLRDMMRAALRTLAALEQSEARLIDLMAQKREDNGHGDGPQNPA